MDVTNKPCSSQSRPTTRLQTKVTAKRKSNKLKAQQQRKRNRTLFSEKNLGGSNDIKVNTTLGIIKYETEPNNLDSTEDEQKIVCVKEEVDIVSNGSDMGENENPNDELETLNRENESVDETTCLITEEVSDDGNDLLRQYTQSETISEQVDNMNRDTDYIDQSTNPNLDTPHKIGNQLVTSVSDASGSMSVKNSQNRNITERNVNTQIQRENERLQNELELSRIHFGDIRTTLIFVKILLPLLAFMDLNTLLKCRLVCKRWNLAVESVLEKLVVEQDFIGDTDEKFRICLSSPINALLRKYTFSTLDTLEQFIQFANSTTNPFVGRHILIHVSMKTLGNFQAKPILQQSQLEDENNWKITAISKVYKKIDDESSDPFWRHLCKMGKSFGEHVRSIHFHHKNLSVIHTAILLARLLAHFPNLKRLTIQEKLESIGQTDTESEEESPNEILRMNNSKDLDELLEVVEMPQLAKLECLEFLFTDKHSEKLLNKLLIASSSLKRLQASVFSTECALTMNKYSANCVKIMRALNTTYKQDFVKLERLNGNLLEKLALDTNHERIRLAKILNTIFAFRNLKSLSIRGFIELPRLHEEQYELEKNMRVENLKIYHAYPDVEPKENFYSKLLSYFPNIKELQIQEYILCRRDNVTENLDFPLCLQPTLESLRETNIWTEMNRLKVVKLKTKFAFEDCSATYYLRDSNTFTQRIRNRVESFAD